MKILAVCSTINFRDFTRRATLEAIKNEVDSLDILLFTGLKNIIKSKITVKDIKFTTYHFWIPENYKQYNILSFIEHNLRYLYWTCKFSRYELIFFTDPNQAWLLPYIKRSRIVYLIRDPNVLQNLNHKEYERMLLDRADIVLATSRNLAELYLKRYHGINHHNIHYWPNCVDINIWAVKQSGTGQLSNPLIGIAGNFGLNRTDYTLLDYITTICQECDFEIAGRLEYNQSKAFWDKMFSKTNVKYLGNIPYDELPEVVARWNVGLITDKVDEYASFMHHNKVYQYLALGIPAVSLRIHNDYEGLYPYVYLADSYEQFVEAIYDAAEQARDTSFRDGCIAMARSNSSEVRATEFLSLVKNN
jgi:glycosyltransferase involved in cell wall biosynthesis